MATTALGTEGHSKRSGEARSVRAYFWVANALVIGLLAFEIAEGDSGGGAGVGTLVAWGVVIAVADSLPVRVWGPITLTMSLPVALAVGMLFDPVTAALVAFVSSVDPRELRGKISISRALYNRSQIALSVFVASWVFHSTGAEVGQWPEMIAPALMALAVDCVANTALVVIPASLISGDPPVAVVKQVVADSPVQYAFAYLVLGLLRDSAGNRWCFGWCPRRCCVPCSVGAWPGRPSFRRRDWGSRRRELEAKNQALKDAVDHVADERRDERMVVAGELHDEVLPPLFKVHLMGQVLKQDLSSGRLLDLDQDLPELLSATQVAQGAIREVLGDLRRSAIGPGGLNSTMHLLARQLESAGSPRIELDLDDVGGSKVTQLLVYQVAREGMANAAKYSKATTIKVRLWLDDQHVRLVIEDDGVGFALSEVDMTCHFGLQFIRERVEAAKGNVLVDSMLGSGTRVVATIPLNT